ncbi:MAG: hypothetical protein JST91_22745 [Actinobacteria bacterium]|nr:hypothetical protein [Actinomycetota bacterium]
MPVPPDGSGTAGPRYETMGFAEFHARFHSDGAFASWFGRIQGLLPGLSGGYSRRLADVQHALIDLIDLLDSDKLRYPTDRSKIPPTGTAGSPPARAV